MSDEALFARQKRLHGLMKRYARSPADSFRGTAPVPGTEQNSAFLILAAMLGGPPATIQRRADRMWNAPPRGGVCPITFAETLGGALVALLSQDRLRHQLDYAEFVAEYEIFSLVWREVEPSSNFGPHMPEEWQAREDDAKRGGLTRVVHLPVQTFDTIAALITEHQKL
jgi:hypothetical protein